MEYLPQDPAILVSSINMLLRDVALPRKTGESEGVSLIHLNRSATHSTVSRKR